MRHLSTLAILFLCMDYILAAVRGDRQSDDRSGLVPAQIDGVIRKRHGRVTFELKKAPVATKNVRKRRSSYLTGETSDLRTKASEFRKQREESGEIYGWMEAFMVKYHPEAATMGKAKRKHSKRESKKMSPAIRIRTRLFELRPVCRLAPK